MLSRSLRPCTGWLCAMLVLAGCASGPSAPAVPTLPSPTPSTSTAELVATTYRLGSGDRIKLTVFRHEDLSGEFALDGAGNFSMPLIGEIQAYGLTTNELVTRIQEKLQEGYLVDPQVGVEVLNYRPFYILGEVKTPGSYPYVNGMTVLNAVALAGGFGYRAKQEDFLLQRGGSNVQGAEVGGDTAILPGDIITVQERFF